MKERNEITRIARFKTIKLILIFDFLIVMLILLLNVFLKISLWILIPGVLILSNIIFWFLLQKSFLYEEEEKESIKIVESRLSDNEYKEVLPNNVSSEYQVFIKSELPIIAKFYARISKNHEHVDIYLKFDKYDGYKFFKYIEKRYFTDEYKIIKS